MVFFSFLERKLGSDGRERYYWADVANGWYPMDDSPEFLDLHDACMYKIKASKDGKDVSRWELIKMTWVTPAEIDPPDFDKSGKYEINLKFWEKSK